MSLVIRNVPVRVVRNLKALQNGRVSRWSSKFAISWRSTPVDRSSVLEQIEASWNKQARRPSAGEIDHWLATGRK